MQQADPSPAGPTLEESYAHCCRYDKSTRGLQHWTTLALPNDKRRHVWAILGFCAHVETLADGLLELPLAERQAHFEAFGDRFFADLARGDSDDLVLKAVVHTERMVGLHPEAFQRFLRSIAIDLSDGHHLTWDDLLHSLDGWASVTSDMLLPILEPRRSEAALHARDLGYAVKLTDLLCSVGRDLRRGRMRLPLEDLDRFGADPWRQRSDAAWRELMAFEIERCRELYASADVGIAMLPPASARCARSVRRLHSGLLDAIERRDHDVFAERVRVSTWTKASVLGRLAWAG